MTALATMADELEQMLSTHGGMAVRHELADVDDPLKCAFFRHLIQFDRWTTYFGELRLSMSDARRDFDEAQAILAKYSHLTDDDLECERFEPSMPGM